jgi:ATP-dependent DNA helicase RecG
VFLAEHTEPVSTLEGVGPAAEAALARLHIHSVSDLLQHYPREYQDRRHVVGLAEAPRTPEAVVLVRVEEHRWIGSGAHKTLRVTICDDTAQASLLCFNRAFLARALASGTRVYVWGRFTVGQRGIEASSFEHEPARESPRAFLRILPVYAATEGLTQAAIRRAVARSLERVLPDLANDLPQGVVEAAGLLAKPTALREIHFPRDPETCQAARRSLAYEELFHLHLAIAGSGRASRQVAGPGSGRPRRAGTRLRDELLRRLPFALTPDQACALSEIEDGLRSTTPGTRLLQGEVGCGKTLVALLAALGVIEAGEQVALMAPTELLARQHAEVAASLLEPLGVRVAFLTSAVIGAARQHLLGAVAGTGEAGVDLVVGTHALFTGELSFRRLGLAVIDEQQRFGVAQRRELVRKGQDVDVLLMTATPIPRTLALTLFGDLVVSEIHGMPAGRKPVATHLARMANAGKVYERVRGELDKGQQAYFVYPLIGAADTSGLKDAERMYERLRTAIYPEHACALIHSRLPETEKVTRMARFARGEVSVLVATSVVEVGVDVPNATCMVVEHAERFGLSALHQLRGRVGRGVVSSYMFLLYAEELTEAGVQRLRVMKETSDGFRIAEEDLRLRGPGAFLGMEQAGYLRLGVADLSADLDLVVRSRDAARELLSRDPELADPDNAILRAFLESRSPDRGLAGG